MSEVLWSDPTTGRFFAAIFPKKSTGRNATAQKTPRIFFQLLKHIQAVILKTATAQKPVTIWTVVIREVEIWGVTIRVVTIMVVTILGTHASGSCNLGSWDSTS